MDVLNKIFIDVFIKRECVQFVASKLAKNWLGTFSLDLDKNSGYKLYLTTNNYLPRLILGQIELEAKMFEEEWHLANGYMKLSSPDGGAYTFIKK